MCRPGATSWPGQASAGLEHSVAAWRALACLRPGDDGSGPPGRRGLLEPAGSSAGLAQLASGPARVGLKERSRRGAGALDETGPTWPGLRHAGLGSQTAGLGWPAGRDGDGPADICHAGQVLYVGLVAVILAQPPEIRPRENKSMPTLIYSGPGYCLPSFEHSCINNLTYNIY
jgi:hypothetical protein